MLIVIFGPAGSGKTYVARIVAKHFGFHHEDADQWLPHEMQDVIKAKQRFTKEMLAEFTGTIINKIKVLQSQGHEKLVISQALYREENRQTIFKTLPNAKFIQVTASLATIRKRLTKRKDWIDHEYALSLYKYFEPMPGAYILENDVEGETMALKQLRNASLG